MKRNKVGHLIRTAVLLLLPLGAGAQAPAPRHSAEVAWGVSVPLGTGYPDKTGAAAFSLRYEYRFAQRWAAGVSVAWDRTADNGVFDGHFDGDAVTGYAERTRQQIPITATLRWYMLGGRTSLLQPYLGAGVGAQWTRFDITGETINTSKADSWGLGRGRHTDLSAARGSSLPRRAGGLPLRFQPVEGRRSKRPARVLPVDRRGTELLKPRAQRPMHPNEPQEGQGPPKPKRPDEPQVSAGLPRRRAQEEIDDIDIHIP